MRRQLPACFLVFLFSQVFQVLEPWRGWADCAMLRANQGRAPVQEQIKKAREQLRKAQHITVLSGAGISAESGVPTFRGPDGLWENHNPQELATPQAFARDPELVWRWYNWRRELIAGCAPNPAHLALAELERTGAGLTIITQNVDGLHGLAGSQNLIEIHGSIWRLCCTGCKSEREDHTVPLPVPPLCPQCGGLLRPAVVWFGEQLEEADLQAAWDAAQSCQVMLVVGTSALVQPAASLALVARRAGAFCMEINPQATSHSPHMDLGIRARAGEVVPALVEGL